MDLGLKCFKGPLESNSLTKSNSRSIQIKNETYRLVYTAQKALIVYPSLSRRISLQLFLFSSIGHEKTIRNNSLIRKTLICMMSINLSRIFLLTVLSYPSPRHCVHLGSLTTFFRHFFEYTDGCTQSWEEKKT